jgi:hypothetical protein
LKAREGASALLGGGHGDVMRVVAEVRGGVGGQDGWRRSLQSSNMVWLLDPNFAIGVALKSDLESGRNHHVTGFALYS